MKAKLGDCVPAAAAAAAAMAEKESYLFPVLVEGSWGAELSKKLRNKLLRYFQSQKSSGGGECQIREKAGCPQQVLVYFAEEEVRKRVFNQETHELNLGEKGKIKLTVLLPETAGENGARTEAVAAQEAKTPSTPEE
uniref:PAR14-like first RRM domain-containing protein n=1 Tax=Sphenodon punctatus TaxID=8508 RepID=A0A8D0HIZ8_SPHPU